MQNSSALIKGTGIVGLAASILVGVGEFLIHYSPNGYDGVSEFHWLIRSDGDKVTIGHYMMVFGMPLYFIGYYHFYLIVKPHREKLARWILMLGFVAFSIGGVWAGSRAMLTEIVKSDDQHLLIYYRQHYEILVNILRFIIFIISVLWVAAIYSGETMLPGWMMLMNPILLLGLVFLSYFMLPVLGLVLVPTAMNVVHFIWFTSSLIVTYNRK